MLYRITLSLLPVFALWAFAPAQSPLPHIQPLAAPIAATAAAGLQADPFGAGLLGGGRDYRVRFTPDGMRFDPALGPQVPVTRSLQLRALAIGRGATLQPLAAGMPPRQVGRQVNYLHGDGRSEHYDVRSDGVALSWRFEHRPAGNGDLLVRYAVVGDLGEPQVTTSGLRFGDELGGVQIGGVTGIDASGASVAGGLHWRDGGLELSLPATFVDRAVYPLVLDPVIGTAIGVSTGSFDDGDPDAAYAASTGRFLVVWRRTFSAVDSDVRGQFVRPNGQLVGGTIFFGSSGTVTPPRVACMSEAERFGVTWTQSQPPFSTVQYQTVDATSGALGPATTLASSQTSSYGPADIGADPSAGLGGNRGFAIVYEDNDLDSIRMRRTWFDNLGGQLVASPVSLFLDGLLGPLYDQPAVSRAVGPDGWLLLVVRRRSPLTGASAIVARTVKIDGSVAGIENTVASSSSDNLGTPETDGYDGRWVVAHHRQGSGANFDAVVATPVTDAGFTQIAIGTPIQYGGTLLTIASSPTVGYGLGRTWLGYRQTTAQAIPVTTLRIAAIDSGSCTNCNDPFTAPGLGGSRIVVATGTSGGSTTLETSLAVWHDTGSDITGQLLGNHGSTGTIVDLGGACGSAVTSDFSHAPGIGSTAMRVRLYNFPSSVIAALFNFAPPGAPAPCGACVWTPLSVTLMPPNGGGIFNVYFPIPCLPSLVGAQFETQWTMLDPTQAPCPLLPGLSVTRRLQLTIGQ
jgi:hypothetical protein